jgi:hypothetical protein
MQCCITCSGNSAGAAAESCWSNHFHFGLQVELLSWKSEKDISGDGALPPA